MTLWFKKLFSKYLVFQKIVASHGIAWAVEFLVSQIAYYLTPKVRPAEVSPRLSRMTSCLVCVVAEKDLDKLLTVIESWLSNVSVDICEVVIICPESIFATVREVVAPIKWLLPKLDIVCERDVFVKEDSVKYGKNGVRTNWLYQQILKLSSWKYSKSDFVILADADTLIASRLPLFDKKGRPYRFITKEYWQPYLTCSSTITRSGRFSPSFVCHFSIVPTSLLEEVFSQLIRILKTRSKASTSIWAGLVEFAECFHEHSGFSEYQLLGAYAQVHCYGHVRRFESDAVHCLEDFVISETIVRSWHSRGDGIGKF